jgi:molybdenum cofactor cytidylyltransferase
MNAPIRNVAGLILAAGQSRRMGRPKMTLPWGETTIIEHVAQVLLQGGANPVIAVTGGMRSEVEGALRELPVTTVFNPQYESGGMISSVHSGLQALDQAITAVLITLGDQPQIPVEVVRVLVREYRVSAAPLIVPSYQMRRGHPWLVARELWPEILALQHPLTLRDFLERKSTNIHYLPVDSNSIIQDIDTPEQYEQCRPK